MKHCVVEDSSFVIAAMDKKDPFHKDAVYIFNKLLKKSNVLIILPPLALYEIIVTLSRKGITHGKIKGVVMKLLHMENVIVNSVTEASALKHCKNLLNS